MGDNDKDEKDDKSVKEQLRDTKRELEKARTQLADVREERDEARQALKERGEGDGRGGPLRPGLSRLRRGLDKAEAAERAAKERAERGDA